MPFPPVNTQFIREWNCCHALLSWENLSIILHCFLTFKQKSSPKKCNYSPVFWNLYDLISSSEQIFMEAALFHIMKVNGNHCQARFVICSSHKGIIWIQMIWIIVHKSYGLLCRFYCPFCCLTSPCQHPLSLYRREQHTMNMFYRTMFHKRK